MTAYLITTIAQPSQCRRCAAATLHGLAEGLPVTVDQAPIPAALEWLILLTGAWTFDLSHRGELWYRADYRIRVKSRTSLSRGIHAEHPCTRHRIRSHA